jgi:hypothetical protein|tara:strand:+ start:27 stop:626 length:600 start_codon:yes stop_codon:yes gene_type:complete
MAGSDITATTIEDTQAASTTFIAAAARPAGAFTLANTSFDAGHSRIITVTTTGSSDAGKTVTIVGTDNFGDTQTEVIISLGSASTVTGTKYFSTIVSATCSAQYAANVSVGMSAAGVAVFFAGRSRLKAFSAFSTATSGRIEFLDGLPSTGSIVFVARTSGVNNASDDVYIPEEGVLFKTALSVYYDTATCKMLTAFHA